MKRRESKPDIKPPTPSNTEVERRLKAEGMSLDDPQWRERFDELLKRAARPKK